MFYWIVSHIKIYCAKNTPIISIVKPLYYRHRQEKDQMHKLISQVAHHIQ